jgi:hypothetical protein
MDVHFNPRCSDEARADGARNRTPTDKLVETVVADFFEGLAFTRDTLDRRYDDLESGRVKPIPGDEVFARLRAKSAARRAEHA